jgi:hypothetical protein
MVGGTGGRKIREAIFEGLSASFKLHLIFIKMRNMYCETYTLQAACDKVAIIYYMTTDGTIQVAPEFAMLTLST